jgi:hypothetical protein
VGCPTRFAGWQPAVALLFVILNGIEDIVTRPDLADRAVFLTLEPEQFILKMAERSFGS